MDVRLKLTLEAQSKYHLSKIEEQKGQLSTAAQCLESTLEAIKKLSALSNDPLEIDTVKLLFYSYDKLGNIMKAQLKEKESHDYYKLALDLGEQIFSWKHPLNLRLEILLGDYYRR